MDKRKTNTKILTEEINEILYSIEDYAKGNIKEYNVDFITLDCTEEDISYSLNESVVFREHFNVDNSNITVPVFFTSIEGVHDNVVEYLKLFAVCSQLDNALMVKNINELLNEKFNDNGVINKFISNVDSIFNITERKYQKYFVRFNNQFNIQKIINSKETNLSKYSLDLQKYLLTKLNSYINDFSCINKIDEGNKIRLLYLLCNLDSDMLLMINNFNINRVSPKIILFLEREEFLSRLDILFLGYFRYLGIDIIIFSPAGLANLELILKGKMFSRIRLRNINNEMDYSLLSNIVEYLIKNNISTDDLDDSFKSLGYNAKLEEYKRIVRRIKYSKIYKINDYIGGSSLALIGAVGLFASVFCMLCNIINIGLCIIVIAIFIPIMLLGIAIMDKK